MTPTQAAIVRAAHEAGIDPATALAYAERESSFNPRSHASKTIHGLFQMSGPLRQQYGGTTDDPYEQAQGWTRFYGDMKKGMSRRLGRDVTDAEAYAGHHFGEGRGARMLTMDPSTPVSQVFTPYERSINPHFDKAGTVGSLLSSVTGDIDRRRGKYGGISAPAAEPMDFAQFGEPVDGVEPVSSNLAKMEQAPLDFSQFGEAA